MYIVCSMVHIGVCVFDVLVFEILSLCVYDVLCIFKYMSISFDTFNNTMWLHVTIFQLTVLTFDGIIKEEIKYNYNMV